MTTSTAPDPTTTSNGNPGTADGSPSGGTDGTQTVLENEATGDGVEPEPEGGGGDHPTTAARDASAEADERDRVIAEYEGLRAQILNNPNRDQILALLDGQSATATGGDDPVIGLIDREFPPIIEDSEGRQVRNRTNEVMKGIAQAIRESVRAEIEAKYEPRLRDVKQTLNGSKFERALVSKGIDAETQESQEFASFRRQFERENPSFKKLREAGRADEAANWMVASFRTRSLQRAGNVAARKRIEDAKGARTNSTSPRGGASAKTSFKSLSDYIKARDNGYNGLGS